MGEYKCWYGILFFFNFDKWWDFVMERGVVLVDEFDIVMELVMLFWGLKLVMMRRRVREVIGFDDLFMGV